MLADAVDPMGGAFPRSGAGMPLRDWVALRGPTGSTAGGVHCGCPSWMSPRLTGSLVDSRPCVEHSNSMSRSAARLAAPGDAMCSVADGADKVLHEVF